jgi:hypothetical protein
MKQIFKIMFLAVSILLGIVSTPALASTMAFSESTEELFLKFPSYKETLEKQTTGKLIDAQEIYFKLTPKENVTIKSTYNTKNLESDFIIEEYSREEFNKISKEKGIGGQEGGSSNWLRMDLQVYQSSGQSDYMAYNFCSWKTKPIFRFQDAIGISVSDGLIISGDSSSRFAEYRFQNPYSPVGGCTILGTEINPHGNGIMAKTYLQPGNALEAFPGLNEYHDMGIGTGVVYNNNNIRNGRIAGNYLHKQLAVGGIGMDINGVPNLSIAGSSDSVSASIFVSR